MATKNIFKVSENRIVCMCVCESAEEQNGNNTVTNY